MERLHSVKIVTRLTLVSVAIMAVVTGVTFAVLQSQRAVLRGTTIQTASANLLISTDNTNFVSSLSGFNYSSILPGGSPSPAIGNPVFVKNTGSTNLAVTMSLEKPVTNPNNVDLGKVYVILSSHTGGAVQRISLQELTAAAATGGVALTQQTRLLAGQSAGYNLQIQMDADALAGSQATLSDIDFSFGGTAVN
jgi:hypothetical protein